MSSSGRPLWAILGLISTAIFLWFFCRGVNFSEVAEAIATISPISFVFALILLSAGYAIRIIRWWLMLRNLDDEIPLRTCIWPLLVGVALNNILPFRAGDAFRALGFRKELKAPTMRVLGTLLLERLFDLSTLLLLFFIGLFGSHTLKVPQSLLIVAILSTGTGITALCSILFFFGHINRLLRWISELPVIRRRNWTSVIQHHGNTFLEAMHILKSPRLAPQLVGLSLLVWGFEGAVFAVISAAVQSGSATHGPWFAMATGTLGTMIPSSPGYIGTFDYLTMLGLIAYGAESGRATAFAIVTHTVLWLPLTLAGLIYFAISGTNMLGSLLRGEMR